MRSMWYPKREPRTFSGGKTVPSVSKAGELEIHNKVVRLDPNPTPLPKINSKWIQGLHVRPETVRLLEEYRGIKFLDMGLGNNFFHLISEVQATK